MGTRERGKGQMVCMRKGKGKVGEMKKIGVEE
jgi:hypothetical protein